MMTIELYNVVSYLSKVIGDADRGRFDVIEYNKGIMHLLENLDKITYALEQLVIKEHGVK